jgi:hypothetical protein
MWAILWRLVLFAVLLPLNIIPFAFVVLWPVQLYLLISCAARIWRRGVRAVDAS